MAAAAASTGAATTASARRSSRMVHAIGWTGASLWATQLITWTCTIILARLLSVADYGLVGMANVFLGLIAIISEFGLGTAVIFMPDITDDHLAQLNAVSVLSGMALFATACAAAYPVGIFFRAPHLPAVIATMSLAFIVSAFKIVPGALLQREFRFKLLAKIQAAQAVGYAISTVVAALLGAGYWSFVVGGLFGPVVSTGLVLLNRRSGFAVPRFSQLRESLTLSWHVLGTRISWYCYSNADFLVAGGVLGQAALGAYTIAWTMATLPVQKVTNVAMRVLPSYFSKAQKDNPATRDYVLTITEALLLVTLPACLGLSLLADELVPAVLGPKWVHAIMPLRILAVYASVRSITNILPIVLNYRNAARFVMWTNIAAAVYFPAAFYIGSHWGTTGIAAMWPLLYPLVAVPLYWRTFKEIQMPIRRYLACLWPALSASTVMTVSLLVVRAVLPAASTARHSRVIVEVLTGAVIYCVTVLLLHYPELRRLKAQLCATT